jgi:hypothetical protein
VTRCGKSKKVLCQPVRIEGMKHFVVFIVLLRRQIRGSVFFDDSVRIFTGADVDLTYGALRS